MKFFNQPLQQTLFLSVFAAWSALLVMAFGGYTLPKAVLALVTVAFICISLFAYRRALILAERISAKGRDAFCYKNTLDALQSKVMLVDEKGVIQYYNHALYKWFRQQETHIEQHISGFAASRLSGMRLPTFFSDIDNFKMLVKTLASPLTINQNFAGISVTLHFVPLMDLDENRLGLAVEWRLPEPVPATQKVRLNEKKLKANLGNFSEILLQTQNLHATAENLNAQLKEPEPKFFEMAKALFALAQESEASRQIINRVIQESASTNQSREHAS